MSWNNNDGPWGPSGGKQNPSGTNNPWTRKGGGNGGGPSGGGPNPPDFDALMKQLQLWMRPLKPNGHFQAFIMGFAALVLVWLLSGFYQVSTDQVGVVMRFGAFNRTEQPGLHYHLPAPLEAVLLPVVTAQNEIQIGFRRAGRDGGDLRPFAQESMMLTEDENIINVQFTVFWRVSDVEKYLFEIRDPERTIRMAAESVMREVIGQNKLQFALTDGRSQIADEARSRLQALMDEYKLGVVIAQINLQTVSVPDEVKSAFQDVVNARLDQERFQNQAAAHVNKVIPAAKGEAAQMLQQAMAYRDQKIAIAQGEADRFKEVLTAYNAGRDVASKRLYLETMEQVLKDANKVIVDKGVGAGAIPYFPMQQITGGRAANDGASR